MDTAEFTEKFREFESSLEVFQKDIEGVKFWERNRSVIYSNLKEKVVPRYNSVYSGENNGSYKRRFFLLLKNIFFRNPFLADAEIVFVGFHRRKRIAEVWEDIYIDPIINSIELNYVYLEVSNSNGFHRSPAKTNELRYIDLIRYGSAAIRKLDVRNRDYKDGNKLIKYIEGKIESKFGAEMDVESLIHRDLEVRKYEILLYKLLFKVINPKYVFIVTNQKPTIIEACRGLGIPVIELQHGFLGSNHPDYSFPHINIGNLEYKPDYMLVWGDYWKNRCDFPLKEENIVPVGFKHLEDKIGDYKDLEKENDLIFISQQTIGEQLSKFAVDVAEETDYDIVYKLHPDEYASWEEDYPWLKESDVEIVSEETPLYELLAKSRAQIGVNSTVIYEGLAFGLQTFIFKAEGYDLVDDLTSYDGVKAINSVSELNIGQNDPDIDRERFFESNPIQNIKNFLEDLEDK